MKIINDHVLNSKLQGKSWAVLKNVPGAPTAEVFKKYFQDFPKQGHAAMPFVLRENYHYFNNWENIVDDLIEEVYGGNPEHFSNVVSYGQELGKSPIHNDGTDVVHWNCFGETEWKLLEFNHEKEKPVFDGTEETIVLGPGDLLYMKCRVWHEAKSLSVRGGLAFRSHLDKHYMLAEEVNNKNFYNKP